MLFSPYFHITTSLSSSTRFILVSPCRGETNRRPNKNCFLALGRSSFSVKSAKHSQKKMPRKRVQVVNILPTTEAFSFCVRLLRQLQKVAFLRKTWIAGFLSQLSLISKEKCVAARSSLRLKLVFAHINVERDIYTSQKTDSSISCCCRHGVHIGWEWQQLCTSARETGDLSVGTHFVGVGSSRSC